MAKWTLSITFPARDSNEAEDIAAAFIEALVDSPAPTLGRTALHYDDPITGRPALWAEPVKRKHTLESERSPL